MLHTTKTHIKLFAGEAPEARGPNISETLLEATTKDKLKSEKFLFIAQEANVAAFIESLPKKDGKIDMSKLTKSQIDDIAIIDKFLSVKNNETIKAQQEKILAQRGVTEQTRKQVVQIKSDQKAASETAAGIRQNSKPTDTVEGIPTLSRVLKRGDKSESIKILQKALGMNEADITTGEGNFGPKTEALLKAYQTKHNITEQGAGEKTLAQLGILAQVVATSRTPVAPGSRTMPEPIARVDSRRTPSRASSSERGVVRNPRTAELDAKLVRRSPVTPTDVTNRERQAPVQKNGQLTREGADVIRDLETVNDFLDAHNRTYGQRGEMISNRNGIVGIVWQLSSPDSRRLARELGMSEDRIKAYGDSLGLDNSKVTDGLIRMALIAVVSGLLSGGTSIALEILGINLTRDYKSGPAMKKILEAMGASGDIDAKRTNVLRSSRTTSRDLEGQGEVLRRQNMLPASLRKAVREITSTGFFLTDILSDLFGGTEKRELEGLIAQFEQSRTLDEAEAILTTIVAILTKKHYEKHGSGAVNSTIADLSKVLQTIRQLKAKNDKVRGKGFDTQRYNRDAASIQAVLDATYGTPNKRINVRGQSYAPALPRNLNPNTLHSVAQMMVDTRVNGDRYSILTNVMRGVQFHYGISFTPDEFISAFTNMRWMGKGERFEFNKRVLSNTGRQRNENFNGLNAFAGVAVMELNGRKIYFKDACTNVLTYVNEIPTVIESASSIPVAIPVGTGGILNPKTPTRPTQTSTPGVEGGVTRTGGGGGIPTITGEARI